MSPAWGGSSREEEPPPVIRDKRRLDPETGELRQPGPGPGPATATAPPAPADEAAAAPEGVDGAEGGEGEAPAESPLEAEARERLEDLRRVTAEYANYRRRSERDRAALSEVATAGVLTGLLEVLDDVDRARQHGDLVGAFAGVAENLERAVGRLGLQRFGEAGDPFDPQVHEALTHGLSAEVTETTAVQVFQPGYRVGERVLRPARVGVADPDPGAGAPAQDGAVSADAPSTDAAPAGAVGDEPPAAPDSA